MAPRERLEDLGLIQAKLERLAECRIFEDPNVNPKSFRDWFSKLSDEEKADFIYTLPCLIVEADHLLAECIVIARGHHE